MSSQIFSAADAWSSVAGRGRGCPDRVVMAANGHAVESGSVALVLRRPGSPLRPELSGTNLLS